MNMYICICVYIYIYIYIYIDIYTYIQILGSVMPDPLLSSSGGSKMSTGSQMSRIDERDEREKEKARDYHRY